MANDLVLMVLQFLINLIGIQKGARHLNFDFEKLTLELCFDWMVRWRLKFYSSQNVNNKISQNSNVKHLFVFQLNLSRTVAPWSRDQLTSISGIFKSLTNIKNTLVLRYLCWNKCRSRKCKLLREKLYTVHMSSGFTTLFTFRLWIQIGSKTAAWQLLSVATNWEKSSFNFGQTQKEE